MVSAAVMGKLRASDTHTTAEFYLPVIDYFLLAHHFGNKSHVDLGREAGKQFTGKSKILNFWQKKQQPEAQHFVTYGTTRNSRRAAYNDAYSLNSRLPA